MRALKWLPHCTLRAYVHTTSLHGALGGWSSIPALWDSGSASHVFIEFWNRARNYSWDNDSIARESAVRSDFAGLRPRNVLLTEIRSCASTS